MICVIVLRCVIITLCSMTQCGMTVCSMTLRGMTLCSMTLRDMTVCSMTRCGAGKT